MKTKLFLFALLFALPCFLFSQKVQEYEYLHMTYTDIYIYINMDSKNFETINVFSEKIGQKGDGRVYDLIPLLTRIESFEKEGWELYDRSVNTSQLGWQINSVLMRKKKP